MGRVIAFSSLLGAAAWLVLRLTSSPAASHPFSASEAVVAGGFVTLAIAALLRD